MVHGFRLIDVLGIPGLRGPFVMMVVVAPVSYVSEHFNAFEAVILAYSHPTRPR